MKLLASLAVLLNIPALAAAPPPVLMGDKLEQVLLVKPTYNEQEHVLKFSFPRNDVKMTIDGASLPPFMGLTTWAAFQPGHRKPAIVAGDIVLFQDEVNPAMSAALDKGLNVTALHNHFFYDEPKVYFMHVEAEGDAVLLAAAVRHTLDIVHAIRAKSPAPADHFEHPPLPATSSIDPRPLDQILGTTGQTSQGMYKAIFGQRVEMPCGCTIGKEMGINTWAAFYGSDDVAVVDGDFTVPAFGLQPILKSLRDGNINIVAIHNHMETEAPRMMFLHYYAVGKPAELARAIRGTLDLIPSAAPAASSSSETRPAPSAPRSP
jgi:hypothetical protein